MGALLKRIEGQGFRLRLADGGQVEVRETGSALTDKQVEWIPANKPTLLTELKVRRGATSEQGRLVTTARSAAGMRHSGMAWIWGSGTAENTTSRHIRTGSRATTTDHPTSRPWSNRGISHERNRIAEPGGGEGVYSRGPAMAGARGRAD
jgi:hypothetical protein